MFHSLKGKFFGNKENTDDVSEVDIMRDENKILKEKMKLLYEENEKLKQVMLLGEKETSKSSNINRLFKDFKTMLFENKANQAITNFKQFLSEHLIFNNIDEEDVDFFNSINISDSNWAESKHIYIFKQRLIEKNYRDMFKNAVISNELREFGSKIITSKSKVTERSSSSMDKPKSPIRENTTQSMSSGNTRTSVIKSQPETKLTNNPVPTKQTIDVFDLLKDEPKTEDVSKNPFDTKKINIPSITTKLEPKKQEIPQEPKKVSLPIQSTQPSSIPKQTEKPPAIINTKTSQIKKEEKSQKVMEIADSFEFEEFEEGNLLDALHEKSNVKKPSMNEVTSPSMDDELCIYKIIFSFSNDKGKRKSNSKEIKVQVGG